MTSRQDLLEDWRRLSKAARRNDDPRATVGDGGSMTIAQDAQRAAEKAIAAPRIEKVRALATAGKNGPQIAIEMNMTRAAVMGLCRRNDIRLGPEPITPRPAPIIAPIMSGCRFPLWGNEAPTHRYCGKRLALHGSPYCAKHHALCYRPPEVKAA